MEQQRRRSTLAFGLQQDPLPQTRIDRMLSPDNFFDLSDPLAEMVMAGCRFAWDAIARIEACAQSLVEKTNRIDGEVMSGAHLGPTGIVVCRGAVIEPGSYVQGPAYIGPGARVLHGAYIRGSVILLEGAVLGHAGEAKNALLMRNAKAPHFAYIGDSVLGARVNLGAGTKLSNVPITSFRDQDTHRRPTVRITCDEEIFDTGLEKLGALLGDDCQTGCNSVLNPGVLLGPGSLVYPNATVRKGYYPQESILKATGEVTVVKRER
jgi:NDP-sugar pyrophosphorylase family protein